MCQEELKQHLNDYYDYHHSILLPTFEEINEKVSTNTL